MEGPAAPLRPADRRERATFRGLPECRHVPSPPALRVRGRRLRVSACGSTAQTPAPSPTAGGAATVSPATTASTGATSSGGSPESGRPGRLRPDRGAGRGAPRPFGHEPGHARPARLAGRPRLADQGERRPDRPPGPGEPEPALHPSRAAAAGLVARADGAGARVRPGHRLLRHRPPRACTCCPSRAASGHGEARPSRTSTPTPCRTRTSGSTSWPSTRPTRATATLPGRRSVEGDATLLDDSVGDQVPVACRTHADAGESAERAVRPTSWPRRPGSCARR